MRASLHPEAANCHPFSRAASLPPKRALAGVLAGARGAAYGRRMSGSGSARSTKTGWLLRLALAYALLLQMVLSAAAMAQHATANLADPWGDPWAATCAGRAATDTDSPPPGAPHMDLCCVLGCLATPLSPLAPDGAVARLEPAPRITAIVFAERPAASPARHASRPFHARGPPRAV
ncbi:hypothetical protein V5G24_12865 [Xanthobacter sp. VTT E-85241]|uniref:hypothetical protein n=1 Tax=Roseixanthobacter finlandensis TaxID=3119922 RepID=UPI0037281DE8